MIIFNLTQHEASTEQLAEGVIARTELQDIQVKELLTFTAPPSREEVRQRAEELAELVDGWRSSGTIAARDIYIREYVRDGDWVPPTSFFDEGFSLVMIGGAPCLMRPLEEALEARYFTPIFSYSDRVSQEETLADGAVRKVNEFKHICFV